MIFFIGFILGCVWHAFIIIRRRAWYFIPLIIGCLRALSQPKDTTAWLKITDKDLFQSKSQAT